MKNSSRRVLAQNLAAQITGAVCHDEPALWSDCETTYERGATAVEKALALCHSCPALQRCRQWAELDQYTGLAAAARYTDGRRKELTTAVAPEASLVEEPSDEIEHTESPGRD